MDEAWGQLIAEEMKSYVARELAKLRAELSASFEQRVAALEEAGPKFRGVFHDGQIYSKGALVISGGSLWHCQVGETSSRPGADSNWLLCVKAGQFSK